MSLAFVTSFTTLGGTPPPPRLWVRATQNIFWQIFALFLVLLQSGNAPPIASVLVAVLFLHVMMLWRGFEDKFYKSEKFNNLHKYMDKVNMFFKFDK